MSLRKSVRHDSTVPFWLLPATGTLSRKPKKKETEPVSPPNEMNFKVGDHVLDCITNEFGTIVSMDAQNRALIKYDSSNLHFTMSLKFLAHGRHE
jgi:dsDNA-specific endonuclease/ATPase MutS2